MMGTERQEATIDSPPSLPALFLAHKMWDEAGA